MNAVCYYIENIYVLSYDYRQHIYSEVHIIHDHEKFQYMKVEINKLGIKL